MCDSDMMSYHDDQEAQQSPDSRTPGRSPGWTPQFARTKVPPAKDGPKAKSLQRAEAMTYM